MVRVPFPTFHSFLELDEKHGGEVKSITEKLTTVETKIDKSAERIKELKNEMKTLEKDKSKLYLGCQCYDENEQKHKHDMEKMSVSHMLKTEQKVVEMDCSNLKNLRPQKWISLLDVIDSNTL